MAGIPNTDSVPVAIIAAALDLSSARIDGSDSGSLKDRVKGFLIAYKAVHTAYNTRAELDVDKTLAAVGLK